MKFEKNNRYFTICVYAVASIFICFIGIGVSMNFSLIWHKVCRVIGGIYGLLKPLIFGIGFAYLMDPLVAFYQQKLCKIPDRLKSKNSRNNKNSKSDKGNEIAHRGVATLFTYVTIILFIWLFVLIVSLNIKGFKGFDSLDMIISNIQAYVQSFTAMIMNVQYYVEKLSFLGNNTTFVEQISSSLGSLTASLSNRMVAIIQGIGSNAVSILLSLVIAFYLLKDKKLVLQNWNYFIEATLPKKVTKEGRAIWHDMDSVLSGYIRGQLTDALIVSILTSVILTIIGLDFAIIIGIIAGISNIIPYFGPVVGFVLAGIIGLLGPQPIKGVYAVVAIMILQQVDGLIIAPKVVGESVKLHPVIVLLSILIGGNLFGILGMLFAVPVAALIRVLLLRYFKNHFPSEE